MASNYDEKPYAVVTFLSDKTISEIPTNWLIEGNEKCWWPVNSRQASQYILRKTEPDNTWLKYDIHLECFCSNLNKARKKADDLNCTSNEDEKDYGRGHRIRHKIPVHHSSSSENSGGIDSDDPPPRLQKPKETTKKKSMNCNIETDSNASSINTVISHSNVTHLENIDFTNIPVVFSENDANFYSSGAASSAQKPQEYHNSQNVAKFFDEGTVQTFQQNFEELLKISKSNLMHLRNIDARLKKLEDQKLQTAIVMPDVEFLNEILPITTIDGLKEFDNNLKEASELSNSFKLYIQTIGGKTAKDNIYRIFKKVYSNELGVQCSWLGQRNNFRICDLHNIKLIKEVLMASYTDLKENSFEHDAKEWFRLAKNRLNRDSKKQVQNE